MEHKTGNNIVKFQPILLDLSGLLVCWFENSDALFTMTLLLQMCHGISKSIWPRLGKVMKQSGFLVRANARKSFSMH